MSRNEVEGFQDCVIPRVVSMAGSFSGLRLVVNAQNEVPFRLVQLPPDSSRTGTNFAYCT